MRQITFSQELLLGMCQYLDIPVSEIAEDEDFKLSRTYLYKVSTGELPLTKGVSKELNIFWNKRDLNSEDLSNIYELIRLKKIGKDKTKEYKLKQYKINKSKGGC